MHEITYSIQDDHFKCAIDPEKNVVSIQLAGSGDFHELHTMSFEKSEQFFLKLLALMRTSGGGQ